ncbi:MAG: hypothetical protein ABH934_02615 [Chloroflexota bacterium]
MQVAPLTIVKKVAVFNGIVVAIAIIGAIFGFLAAAIGAQLLQDGAAGFGGLVGALAGMVIGYPIGVVIGIFFINKVLRYRGSLLFGAIGSIIGVVFIIGLAEPLGINNNPDLLWALILLLPPLLGTIGFYLRR